MAGFLRKRTIKGSRYYYWAYRQRRKKKDGGDGKVKSCELLLGKNLCGGWESYYIWVGDICSDEYIDACMCWLLGDIREHIDCSWTVNKGKPVFSWRSKPGTEEDLRSQWWRETKSRYQACLENLHFTTVFFDQRLQAARQQFKLAFEYRSREVEWQTALDEYNANPDKEWDEEEVWVHQVTGEEVRDSTLTDSQREEIVNGWADGVWNAMTSRKVYRHEYYEDLARKIPELIDAADQSEDCSKAWINDLLERTPPKYRSETKERLAALLHAN